MPAIAIDQAVFSLDSFTRSSSLELFTGSVGFGPLETGGVPGEGKGLQMSFEALHMRTVTTRVKMVVTGEAKRLEKSAAETKSVADLLPDYLKPEAVAQRILDFITAAAGRDASLLALLIDAAEQGFADAEAIFGGHLPDVSYQTMDVVREALAQLAGSISGNHGQLVPSAVVEIQVESRETTVVYASYSVNAQSAPVA